MNLFVKLLSILVLAFIGNQAYASGEFWSSPEGDKSIEFLGILFGTMGTALSGPGGGVLGTVMQVFNIAVLSIGSIVVTYTIILTTINTAQEGEVMGRKWSSVWIPFRSAIGAALLIPAPQYSLLQIIFMQITVLGIHAANQVWQVTIATFGTTGLEGKVEVGSDDQLMASASHLLHGLTCAEIWNTTYAGLLPSRVVAYIHDVERKLFIGIPGSSDYKNICGGLEPGSKPSIALDASSWLTSNYAAFQNAASILEPAAEAAAAGESGSAFSGVVVDAARAIQSAIAATPRKSDTGSSNPINPEAAANNGWLYAGSFYFAFADSPGSNYRFDGPSQVEPELSEDTTGDTGERIYDVDSRLASAVFNTQSTGDSIPVTSPSSSSIAGTRLELSPPTGLSSEGQDFVKAITGPLRQLAYKFMDHLTERYSDPLVSVRAVGAEIMITCEIIWFAIIAIAAILLIVGCTMSGMQPLCYAIGSIGLLLVSVLSLLIVFLWGIGCTLGIYIPMVPYLVFTFTALGWFVLVIETIVAAPIVALGIVSPAQEVMGKAAPAVLLITGVFLRPSLMVIGFVGSILLVRTIIAMINYGFAATVEASIAGIGVFGVIALITLYGGLILAIIHECFSLIYILPDRILRWIGGQVEKSTAAEQTKELEKDVGKGAQLGGSLMKGTASMAGSAISEQMAGGSGLATKIGDMFTGGGQGQSTDLGGDEAGGDSGGGKKKGKKSGDQSNPLDGGDEAGGSGNPLGGGKSGGGKPGGGSPGGSPLGGGAKGGGKPSGGGGGGMPGGGMPGGGALPGGGS